LYHLTEILLPYATAFGWLACVLMCCVKWLPYSLWNKC